MIPATTKRLILNPAPLVSEPIDEQVHAEMSRYSAAPPGVLEQRLQELDHEWNVERLTVATSALLLLLGLGLVSLQGEQWLVFPVLVAASLLLHALVGWTPILPLIRALGVRTSREITSERCVLESFRGEVQMKSLATAVQDREVLSHFENEGGSPLNAPGVNAFGSVAGNDEPRAPER